MRRAALVWPLALVALAAPQLLAEIRQAPPAQTPDTAPKGSGIIAGRVVDATSGQPIADAIVTMNGRGPGVARGGAPPARGRRCQASSRLRSPTANAEATSKSGSRRLPS